MLKVERLFAGYGEIQILKDISFEVGQGQVISIVGANCAGKSTLLNTISGILTPISGRIVFEGEDLTHRPGHQIVQKGIVQVPEGRKLFPAMNVKDNLFVGASFPRAKKVRQQSLEQVCKLFPVLRERMNQVAETLASPGALMPEAVKKFKRRGIGVSDDENGFPHRRREIPKFPDRPCGYAHYS